MKATLMHLSTSSLLEDLTTYLSSQEWLPKGMHHKTRITRCLKTWIPTLNTFKGLWARILSLPLSQAQEVEQHKPR
jgi:hypothetical protein